MSTCADVGSFIESKTTVVQTSNVGFTSEVSDYLVVHTGPDFYCVSTFNARTSHQRGGKGKGDFCVFSAPSPFPGRLLLSKGLSSKPKRCWGQRGKVGKRERERERGGGGGGETGRQRDGQTDRQTERERERRGRGESEWEGGGGGGGCELALVYVCMFFTIVICKASHSHFLFLFPLLFCTRVMLWSADCSINRCDLAPSPTPFPSVTQLLYFCVP